MFRKCGLTFTAALVASAAFTSAASADGCLGLDCAGVTPSSSTAYASAQIVETPQDLESERTSGFYDFGSAGPEKQRAIAYVVAPGEWDSPPVEIKQLPAAASIPAGERAANTIVFYGARTVVSVPPAQPTSAAPALTNTGTTVSPFSFGDCPSGYFCLFDSTNGNGARGQWASTGYWQNLSSYGWANRARSMRNRRNGWTLLEKSASARYCAIPNSQDGSLANNGYDQNTTRVYLSTSTTKHAAWNCTN